MWIFHEPGPKVTGEKVRPRLRAVGESRRPHTGPPSCYSTNRDRITIYIGVHLRQHSATQQIILQRISDIYMFIYHIYTLHLGEQALPGLNSKCFFFIPPYKKDPGRVSCFTFSDHTENPTKLECCFRRRGCRPDPSV